MTFIQRFGDALNLNVHRQNSQPLLAELYGASVSGRVASDPRAGRRTAKVGDAFDLEDMAVPSIPRCATIAGFSVHANVGIPGQDRMRLERLCRYAGRPPVASERLSRLSGGRLLYRLKRRWRDGTTHLIFEALELVEKLAALVPPPRFNLVRYYVEFPPSAAWRDLVIPESETAEAVTHANCPARKQPFMDDAARAGEKRGCRPRNYSWAELMRRVFSADVLKCDRCGGRMRIIAAITPPEAIRKILDCLGLPSRPPPLVSALRLDDLDFS